MDLIVVQQGNLAEAMSRSANNPFIFKSTRISDPLDPGRDRIAAVPVKEAVKTFQPTKVIVMNVTVSPAFISKNNEGVVKEILISVDVNNDAIKGVCPEFEKAYWVGYQTTKAALQGGSQK